MLSFDEKKKRFGVQMIGSGEMKSIKMCNLVAYSSTLAVREMCWKCGDEFWPDDFAPCGCQPTATNADQISWYD